jgi:predicted membrane-bound mannosyltransferase
MLTGHIFSGSRFVLDGVAVIIALSLTLVFCIRFFDQHREPHYQNSQYRILISATVFWFLSFLGCTQYAIVVEDGQIVEARQVFMYKWLTIPGILIIVMVIDIICGRSFAQEKDIFISAVVLFIVLFCYSHRRTPVENISELHVINKNEVVEV